MCLQPLTTFLGRQMIRGIVDDQHVYFVAVGERRIDKIIMTKMWRVKFDDYDAAKGWLLSDMQVIASLRRSCLSLESRTT